MNVDLQRAKPSQWLWGSGSELGGERGGHDEGSPALGDVPPPRRSWLGE